MRNFIIKFILKSVIYAVAFLLVISAIKLFPGVNPLIIILPSGFLLVILMNLLWPDGELDQ